MYAWIANRKKRKAALLQFFNIKSAEYKRQDDCCCFFSIFFSLYIDNEKRGKKETARQQSPQRIISLSPFKLFSSDFKWFFLEFNLKTHQNQGSLFLIVRGVFFYSLSLWSRGGNKQEKKEAIWHSGGEKNKFFNDWWKMYHTPQQTQMTILISAKKYWESLMCVCVIVIGNQLLQWHKRVQTEKGAEYRIQYWYVKRKIISALSFDVCVCRE